MTSPIRLVGLDAWQTCITMTTPPSGQQVRWAPLLTYLAQKYGTPFGDPTTFLKVYANVKVAAESQSELSGRHIGLLPRIVMAVLGLGVPAEAINMVQLAPVATEVSRNIAQSPASLVDPLLVQSLARIKERGVKIGLISNLGAIDAIYMDDVLAELGILPLLDVVLYSDITGLCKPNPEVFALLCERAGVAPDETVFIGDNRLADYDGPRAFGMKAVCLGEFDTDVVSAQTVTHALENLGLLD